MLGDLTGRERKLVQGIVEGLPIRSAGEAAGYPQSMLDSKIYSVVRKDRVKQTIEEMMEECGLSTKRLFAVHADMLHATKPISAVIGKDANTSTMDFIEVPDWSARGSALNMGYKLKGLYQERLDVSVESHEERMRRLKGSAD
jgi:hypothetical protein